MAVSTENTPPGNPPKMGALVASTPLKHRPAPLYLQSEAEKFPAFLPAPKFPIAKSKSLTSVELASSILSTPAVHRIGDSLRNSAAPMSLEEARQRRESIKEERKKSIEFIRRRTISRAAAAARPSAEILVEPKWGEVVEKEKGEGEEGELVD